MAGTRSRRGRTAGMPAGRPCGLSGMARRVAAGRGLLAAVLLGLGLPGGAWAQARGTDRVLDLVAEARRSPCFTAPSRPPAAQVPGAEVTLAAEGGDAAAMQRLAEAWLAEPTRTRQALGWLERAALAGAPGAAAEAGSLHAAGRGTPQDALKAAQWWLFGATRGDTRAMACLSAAYLLGRGRAQHGPARPRRSSSAPCRPRPWPRRGAWRGRPRRRPRPPRPGCARRRRRPPGSTRCAGHGCRSGRRARWTAPAPAGWRWARPGCW